MQRFLKVAPIYAAIMTFALITVGCGGGWKPFVKSAQEEQTLIFGYLDMDDAPTSLQWVQLKQLRPVTKGPYYHFIIDDGLFYRTDTPKGIFKFESFGGLSRLRNMSFTFKFPAQGKGAMDPVIDKPGIYYVGSYKFKKVKTGFFEEGKFELEKISKPSEKELLVKLMAKAEHPSWKTVIQKRVQEIK